MFIKEYPEIGSIQRIDLDKPCNYIKVIIDNKKVNLLLTDIEMVKGIQRYQNNIDKIIDHIKIKTKLTPCVFLTFYACFVTSVILALLIKYMR